MHLERFAAVVEKIKACPDEWDQTQWHCGTKHCFAGWAQIMSGKPADDATVRRDARAWLQLTSADADYFFSGVRKLVDFANALIDPDGAGFDCAGFDCAGFDCDGFGRDGFGRDGFDRDGHDRDGHDRDGFDRDGLDREFQLRVVE